MVRIIDLSQPIEEGASLFPLDPEQAGKIRLRTAPGLAEHVGSPYRKRREILLTSFP